MSLPPTKEVPHTCKIVNYFKLLIYFWWGANCWGKGLWKDAREWGQEGWEKGGGVRGCGKGSKGVESIYLNEVLNKTGIVSFDSGVGTHIPIRNRNEIGGNP